MSCAVPGCKSHSSRKQNDDVLVTFHRFPKNTEIKSKWLEAIKRQDFKLEKRSICSKHFDKDCFMHQENVRWRRLKPEAVPTLFLLQCEQEVGQQQLEENLCTSNATITITYQNKALPIQNKRGASQKKDSTCAKKPRLDLNEITTSTEIKTKVPLPLQDITKVSQNIPKEGVVLHSNTQSQSDDQPKIEESVGLQRKVIECERLKNRLSKMDELSKRRLLKINALKQRNRRIKKKYVDLNTLLEHSLNNGDIAREQLLILESLKSNEVIKRFAAQKEGNSLPREFSLELKKFAVTLHYLSPKAYNFVREEFNKVLPHPKTISSWYKAIDCQPGFTSEALEAIRLRVENCGRILYCALIIDEMAIRQLIEWDGKKYYGYVNIGCELESDAVPIAKEALTFMVTCFNDSWKIPVGYFLIHSITAAQKATLVKQCIGLLKETGINVVSLTYDGATTNIAMAATLCEGPSKTYFKCNGVDVCLWPDPCHNIKLVRNALGEKKKLFDGEGKLISWEFIEKLHKIQQEEGLHLGTKLKKDHVEYVKQKMKVRLATQLLSTSVADALQFCKDLELPDFLESEGTIKFIRIFNNLFDIFNSRNMRAKGWKKPTAAFNFPEIKKIFDLASTYINQLKFENGTYVVNSNRKTGFVGFLTCMGSLQRIYANIVSDQNSPLNYLCTYKLNQDHLELFFGAIRSLGGFNNNPSARMFQAAYKKLLVHAQFRNGSSGNCVPLECIAVLNFSPKKNLDVDMVTLPVVTEQNDNEITSIMDHDYLPQPNNVSVYSKHVIKYIAGFVVRKIKLRLNCEICTESLTSKNLDGFSLIKIKNRGGLIYPSKDVVQVCELVEKNLRAHDANKKLGTPGNIQKITAAVLSKLAPTIIFSELVEHCVEQNIEYGDDHRHALIKSIVHIYLIVRIHHMTKALSVPTDKIRNFLTKTILFKGQ